MKNCKNVTNEEIENYNNKANEDWIKFKDITYEEMLKLAERNLNKVYTLYRLFIIGRGGLNVDKQKALECLRACAKTGDAFSQERLGIALFNLNEYDEALCWLEKSAEQGKHYCYAFIAQIYDSRVKNEQDIEKNFKYWKAYFQKTKLALEKRKFVNEKHKEFLANLSDNEICKKVSEYYKNGSPFFNINRSEKLAKCYQAQSLKFL